MKEHKGKQKKKSGAPLVKAPSGQNVKTIPPDVVDIVCAKALSDKVPALDVYFAGVGYCYQDLWRAKHRVSEGKAHPHDEYLMKKCEKTQARIEIECLKDWRNGDTGAASLLQALCQRYNSTYRANVNPSLKAFCRLARKRMSLEDYTLLLQDIIAMEPGLETEEDEEFGSVPTLPGLKK